MNKDLKKFMLSGAALLMLASVGAGANGVNVSAKHVRSHRVLKHHKARRQRKALRQYRHLRRVHKYNGHKLNHRKNVRKWRANKHHKSLKVSQLSKKNRHAYLTGLKDGGNAAIDDAWDGIISNKPIVHKHLMYNLYYDIGYNKAFIDNDEGGQFGKARYYVPRLSKRQLKSVLSNSRDLAKNAINTHNQNVRD